jgi:hypothetical protein
MFRRVIGVSVFVGALCVAPFAGAQADPSDEPSR